MILKEYISTLDPKEKIKIGAKNGSGFFYVGTAEDFLFHLTEYEKGNSTYYDERMKKSESRLLSELNKDTSFSGWAKSQFKRWRTKGSTPKFEVDDYNDFLKSYSALITKLFNCVKQRKQNKILRKPLPTRQVSNHFIADYAVEDDKVIAITIEGKENGAFWGLYETDGKPHLKYVENEDSIEGVDDGD